MPVSHTLFIAPLLAGYVAAMAATPLLRLTSLALPILLGIVAVPLLVCRRLPVVAGAALGMLISVVAAHDALDHRVAACAASSSMVVRGIVVGLPKASQQQLQFDLASDAVEPWPACAGATPRRLRLSWFDGPVLVPGELWQLQIKLRSIHGYQNPVGFDYEAWNLANRIDGGGSVRYGERIAGADTWSWDRLRLALRERYASIPLAHRGILLALVTGDGALMSEADWSLFRETGTVHLMVISGLHLAIVAAAGVALGRWLARLSPRLIRRSGCVWPEIACGAVLVTLYACLAGWGVPVARSWLAVMIVLLLMPLGRRLPRPTVLLWIATVVLSCDPLAPLQAGFWLSFGAVAILVAHFAPRIELRSALRTLLGSQAVLAIGMVPVLIATIGGIAWIAPLANLVALPLISIVVVPMDLIVGVIAASVDTDHVWLADVADSVAGFVVAYLRALAQLDWIGWRAARGGWVIALSVVACCLVVLPLSRRHRVLLLPCVVLAVIPVQAHLGSGEFDVTVLDVGQGLSIAVETQRHRLLFDAGPRFPSGFDLGSAVVVPNLRRNPRATIDATLLSHADTDHVGGYAAVAAAFRVRALLGGEPVRGFDAVRGCHAGQGWQWDGVRFRVIHPSHKMASDNDLSCVLLIENGRRRALLPGDITRSSERELERMLGTERVDFLVAAHHGSRTSSTEPFVAMTRPRIVAISAGFMNRFGHPHPDVICRFERVAARRYLTAESGALSWRSDRPAQVVQWRYQAPPYWRVGNRSDIRRRRDEWTPPSNCSGIDKAGRRIRRIDSP